MQLRYQTIRPQCHQSPVIKTHADAESNSTASVHGNFVPLQISSDLLLYLEDALRFLRNVVHASDGANGDDVHSFLLSQCSKISELIDENFLKLVIQRIPDEYSIIDLAHSTAPRSNSRSSSDSRLRNANDRRLSNSSSRFSAMFPMENCNRCLLHIPPLEIFCFS